MEKSICVVQFFCKSLRISLPIAKTYAGQVWAMWESG